jgi:hypothetical protein
MDVQVHVGPILNDKNQSLKSVCQATEKSLVFSQMPLVHTCNPSYSGGRDQED